MEEHFWINPLHLDNVDGNDGTNTDPDSRIESRRSRSIDDEWTEHDMNTFFESVEVANEQAQDLKNHILDVKFTQLEPESVNSQEYKFLKVPDDIITNIDSGLLEIYHYLQRYAAALFHLLKETSEDDEYHEKLKNTKDNMVRMLCDIQSAVVVSSLTPYEDVTYDMLPTIIRTKRNSFMATLRDFIIIRDYAKFLQYILSKKDVLTRVSQ